MVGTSTSLREDIIPFGYKSVVLSLKGALLMKKFQWSPPVSIREKLHLGKTVILVKFRSIKNRKRLVLLFRKTCVLVCKYTMYTSFLSNGESKFLSRPSNFWSPKL